MYRSSESCILWHSNLVLSKWVSTPRTTFTVSVNAHTHTPHNCPCASQTRICHLFATLDNQLLRYGPCLTKVSLCSLEQHSNPKSWFPETCEAPASKCTFLETKHADIGFATASPSIFLSCASFDVALCFLFERKWQQENIGEIHDVEQTFG